MEYRKIMDASKKTFSEHYEDLMTKYSNDLQIPEDLQRALKAKRDLGLEKYKEYSFQSSFENSITTPILQHLEEELIDALNYCLQARFVFGITDPSKLDNLQMTTTTVLTCLRQANALK